MKIYQLSNYPNEKIPIKKNIVELFTQDERIGFYQSYFNKILNRIYERAFGANYGLKKPGGSYFLRGIETDNLVYEINKENKSIIKHPKKSSGSLWILLEMDKISEYVVIEGTLEEVLNEFNNAGFKVK